ncbi:MAG: hypothetical protein LBJ08_05105 [Bifidobacteriaceae bacterium]|nr:hypothetical protein [Bifidobacteriaceae bacterium]
MVVRRAKDVTALGEELAANQVRLQRLVDTAAPGLLDLKGVAPITGARSRQAHDLETQAYTAKRLAEGKTERETRCCLKRRITRQLYRQLRRITA